MRRSEKRILYSVIVFTIVLVVLMIVERNKNSDDDFVNASFPEELLNITYREYKDDEFIDACLTFYDDNKYSLYDCDSEPTNYPFDSEWECKAEYDNGRNEIIFKCLEDKKVKIKINKWDKEEFVFEYDNKEHTFKVEK